MREPDPMKVAAISAKALMLEPGRGFVIEVEGGPYRAEHCVEALEAAVVRDHAAALKLELSVAPVEEIEFGMLSLPSGRDLITISRDDDAYPEYPQFASSR